MTGSLFPVFGETFLAVSPIALALVGSGLVVRYGIVPVAALKPMSDAIIRVFMPCLIFSNVVRNLDPAALPGWWQLPLMSVVITMCAFALTAAVFLFRLREKRDVLPIGFAHNAAMLNLPIGAALFPEQFDRFALYIFLYILVHNPMLWTVGKFLIADREEGPFRWRSLVTPPFAAILAGILFALTGLGERVPEPVLDGAALVGGATVPLCTFVLGGVLGSIQLRFLHYWTDAVRALVVKLLVMPALVVAVLATTSLGERDPVLSVMLVLQGASAPATALILMVKTYGGDTEKAGTMLVIAYIVGLFTIPFWITVWEAVGR